MFLNFYHTSWVLPEHSSVTLTHFNNLIHTHQEKIKYLRSQLKEEFAIFSPHTFRVTSPLGDSVTSPAGILFVMTNINVLKNILLANEMKDLIAFLLNVSTFQYLYYFAQIKKTTTMI